MLPYIEQPVWQVGPLTIHAFGVAVAVAMWYGLTLGQQRLERAGLNLVVARSFAWWILIGGMLGAHLFSVFFYFPHKLRDDPLTLLRVWEDISSFGGMIGGAIGALLFLTLRARDDVTQAKLAYMDAVAFVFPGALAIGRMGCALAHDHPGVVTSFPLAIGLASDAAFAYMRGVYANAGLSLPANAQQLGFHDLGLYELLILALVIVPLFAYWNRRARKPGFYLVAFAAIYLPIRFGLDMLRVADARYLGLTPAQWTAAIVLTALPLIVMGRRKARYVVTGAAILGTAWACWAGTS